MVSERLDVTPLFIAAPPDFLAGLRCGLLDQSGNLLRARGVDRVAGIRDFERAAVGPDGIPPFEVGVDGSVFRRY